MALSQPSACSLGNEVALPIKIEKDGFVAPGLGRISAEGRSMAPYWGRRVHDQTNTIWGDRLAQMTLSGRGGVGTWNYTENLRGNHV